MVLSPHSLYSLAFLTWRAPVVLVITGSTCDVLLSQKVQATWSWVCTQLLSLLMQYPGGVSEAITLTELSERWHEQVLAHCPLKVRHA